MKHVLEFMHAELTYACYDIYRSSEQDYIVFTPGYVAYSITPHIISIRKDI